MALDHYISQVYLKNFNSPKLGHLMHAMNKGDLKHFTPFADSICRIEEGNTNPYLKENRLIEEFLKEIEPKYNLALSRLKNRKIDNECIYTIAGFIAYVMICSPAGMRLNSTPLRGPLEESARILDNQGKLRPPPPSLGGKTPSDLLSNGKAKIEIDPKYPQAIGINRILDSVSMFGNFTWEILINEYKDSPFFTSDYPVAIERLDSSRPMNKIIPLDPFMAIRIIPDPTFNIRARDFTFANFKSAFRKPNRKKVNHINKLIVRCAENIVVYCDDHDWIPRFIQKNSSFRIEPKTTRFPDGNGTLSLFTQDICEI